ncbi:MAG: hypothetical protein HYW86_02575 [Candidatus Roizmanbacteria bacterium]|nr:MAG: hypothetical protein HYW86_02575 [Candidatus Roizmanbacteria bacterium]
MEKAKTAPNPFPRRLEALSLQAQGLTYNGIAERMGIESGTVKNHLTPSRLATDSNNGLAAILAFLDEDWFDINKLTEGSHLEMVSNLTERECDVMGKMIEGDGKENSNTEIAAQLEISKNTIHNHLKSIYKKIDAKSRTQAGVMCFAYAAITFGAIAFMKSQGKIR